jgi:hypothetical protein
VRGEYAFSQRRACGLMTMAVSSYRYQSRRSDEALRTRLVELAGAGPPFPILRETTTTVAAPPFAVFEGWEARTSNLPKRADFEFGFLLFVHQDRARVPISIVSITAPAPLVGFEH